MVASRGWNYQTVNVSPSLTLSIYADPPSGGSNVRAFIGAGVTGLVPTVLTSAANADANLVGALGITQDVSNNMNVVSELSAGSSAAVPGTPLLVSGTLTLNQTWTPYPGATATVVAVGTMPHASACPTPASGAQVRYTFPGYDDSIAYVPGCGITDLLNNSSGEELALISVGSYPSIGTLATKVERVTLVDTARSALGLERNPFKSLPGLGSIF